MWTRENRGLYERKGVRYPPPPGYDPPPPEGEDCNPND